MIVHYFGCLHRPGHFWHSRESLCRIVPADIKKTLLPKYIDYSFVDFTKKEGEAVVTAHASVTILAFKDNSVDTRPGSHSTFVIEGLPTPEDALRLCKEQWPEVFERFKFEVVLA